MTIGVVVKNNTESTIFTQKSQFYAKIRHSFRVYKNAPQQGVRSPFFHRTRSFLRDFPELCGIHRSHVATPIQNVRLQDDISVAVLYKIVSAP